MSPLKCRPAWKRINEASGSISLWNRITDRDGQEVRGYSAVAAENHY